MASKDDQLWEEVSQVLGTRAHWRVEQSPTPGVPPSWCFGTGGEVDLAVSVDGGAIQLYVMDQDRDVNFQGTDALVRWLDGNEAGSVRDPLDVEEVADELLHGKITKWGTAEG